MQEKRALTSLIIFFAMAVLTFHNWRVILFRSGEYFDPNPQEKPDVEQDIPFLFRDGKHGQSRLRDKLATYDLMGDIRSVDWCCSGRCCSPTMAKWGEERENNQWGHKGEVKDGISRLGDRFRQRG
jgi:hypothetical protein